MQALHLMNDVQHVEAARALAQRILKEGGTNPGDRARWAWRLVTARYPSAEEAQILLNALQAHRERYLDDVEAATELINFGDSLPDPDIAASELAAWTLLANLLLNLDEVVNKN